MIKPLFTLFILIISCATGQDGDAAEVDRLIIVAPELVLDSVLFGGCDSLEVSLTKGRFRYELHRVGPNHFMVWWGDVGSMRIYPDTFECWGAPNYQTCDFTPAVDLMTEQEVVLKTATATPSAGNCRPIQYKMICLPRKINRKPYEIENYLKHECGYIIYFIDDSALFVMSLKSKKTQRFSLAPAPLIVFKTIEASLDSIRIEGEELRFNYLTGSHDSTVLARRSFKLKI